MTKITCERRDCKHWVDDECSLQKIVVKERTISDDEEVAVCSTFEIVTGVC
ncbi:MAG: DUF1540 domain-containing protein [Candidatus Bathyarchaeota archaeon]|nr:MAG: DUF1540 domain-containing protein [Candidatus Bathyarchaeota archaeon]